MCSICNHPKRTEIERDLLVCPSLAPVAAQYHLSLEEARKHKARLKVRVAYTRKQLEQLQLEESLARLRVLLDKTMQVLTRAEENGDLKMMLQAIREAGRLTKMLHSMDREQEAATLFLTATSKDWPQSATHLSTPPQTRESVRQAIQQSLLTPCTGIHLVEELLFPQKSAPEKPVPAGRLDQTWQRLQDAVTTWPSALKAAKTPPDSPSAAEDSRSGAGLRGRNLSPPSGGETTRGGPGQG